MIILTHLFFLHSLTKDTVVSGCYGPLEFASPTAKHKSKSVFIGTVIKAVGTHEHEVRFVNGEVIICKSYKLKVV